MSMILGVISLVSMIIVIYLTYKNGGEAKGGYGVTGLLATIFSLTGLVLGIITLKEKENYKLFPFLGTILNSVVLIGIGFLLYLGRMK